MDVKSRLFQKYIEEQLGTIPDLVFRRMFGGFGLYADEVFFGIIHQEMLYFYTSDRTQIRYQQAGGTCFMAPGSKKVLKRYYLVPVTIVEHQKNLVDWAQEAIEAARLKG